MAFMLMMTLKDTSYAIDKTQQNLQLLDILACNSASNICLRNLGNMCTLFSQSALNFFQDDSQKLYHTISFGQPTRTLTKSIPKCPSSLFLAYCIASILMDWTQPVSAYKVTNHCVVVIMHYSAYISLECNLSRK